MEVVRYRDPHKRCVRCGERVEGIDRLVNVPCGHSGGWELRCPTDTGDGCRCAPDGPVEHATCARCDAPIQSRYERDGTRYWVDDDGAMSSQIPGVPDNPYEVLADMTDRRKTLTDAEMKSYAALAALVDSGQHMHLHRP